MSPAPELQADFDGIARLEEAGARAESPYLHWLARQLPSRLGTVLEVGCGTGAFSRLLAARADRVLALDLSPEMIRVAQARSTTYPNVRYEVCDFEAWAPPPEAFDAVVSVATLHHLAFVPALEKMKQALRPGGVLGILDLLDLRGARHLGRNFV
ncbi:MAG TPA: class I SAM-dependent methyltransferase, partial [Rhodothermales bacterium]|nr:class I SAM-dependent methyltransferase [Rhodothermales bacterium]